MDLDSDGAPDLIDLAWSRRCFRTSSYDTARWVSMRFGHDVPSLAMGNFDIPWAQNIILRGPEEAVVPQTGYLSTGVVNNIYNNCSVDGTRAILRMMPYNLYDPYGDLADASQMIPGDPMVAGSDVIFTDFDADGAVDILRNAGSNVKSLWRLHLNQFRDPARTPETAFTDTVNGGTLGQWISTGPWERTSDFYPLRNEDTIPQATPYYPLDPYPVPINNGTWALSAQFVAGSSVGGNNVFPGPHTTMSFSSGEAGYLADFTGDGLPDRLAMAVRLGGIGGIGGFHGYVLYRSRGQRSGSGMPFSHAWGPGQEWALPTSYAFMPPPPGAGSVRVPVPRPSASLSWRFTEEPAGTETGYANYVTDLVMDFNGDGLLDIVSSLPDIFFYNADGQASPTTIRDLRSPGMHPT